jgi:hypothetical protein
VVDFGRNVVCALLIGCLGVLVPARQAAAAALGTADLARVAAADSARERLLSLVERDDVARELARYGVGRDEARARIAALSDAELEQIAGRLDRLPAAGSDAVGMILIGLLILFATLVITDMVGWTDVFPQVGPYSR